MKSKDAHKMQYLLRCNVDDTSIDVVQRISVDFYLTVDRKDIQK